MNISDTTPLCYANTSTKFMYAPEMGKVYFSATFTTLGLISNLIAFIVLITSCQRTKSRSRSFFLIFLGGLVVTDFMGLLVTGSFVISFYITHVDWRHTDPACHFCNFMGMSMVFYGLCPLLLGATMAMERFTGINCPFARSTNVTKGRTISMVLMVWFFAGCISLLPLTGFGSYHIQTPGSWCYFNISSERHDWAFSLLFSCVGLISIAVSILLNTVSVVTLIKVCRGPDRSQRRRDHEVEMMVQLILIMTIATICWCPLLIYILMSSMDVSASHDKLLFYIRMACLNQILDPWIYILFRRSRLRRVKSNEKNKSHQVTACTTEMLAFCTSMFNEAHGKVFIAQTALAGGPVEVRYMLLWIRFATWNQIFDPWVYILFRRSVLKRVNPRLDWSRNSIMTLYPSLYENMRRFTRSSIRGNMGSNGTDNAGKSNVSPGSRVNSTPSSSP